MMETILVINTLVAYETSVKKEGMPEIRYLIRFQYMLHSKLKYRGKYPYAHRIRKGHNAFYMTHFM